MGRFTELNLAQIFARSNMDIIVDLQAGGPRPHARKIYHQLHSDQPKPLARLNILSTLIN